MKTREEQIFDIAAQYAINETDGQNNGKAASMRGVLFSAFHDGARWADQHPQWIPVEERLPESHFADTSSDWVLVCTTKGGIFIDSYNHKHNEWCNNRTSVTHWMPRPAAPRKED